MIEREFAGALRRFQLYPPNPDLLYRGFELDHGSLPELAARAGSGRLSSAAVAHIITHALSCGDWYHLDKAREIVSGETASRPWTEFAPLALEILTDAYAGPE